MKKNLLIAYLFILTSSLFAQNFGEIGTEWYYSENAQGAGPPNQEYVHIKSVQDTTIESIVCHKLTNIYYRQNGDTSINSSLYLYENLDTVFIYDFDKSKFKSLYIFNASQGDTLLLDIPYIPPWETDSTYRLLIDTIINVNIDGIPLSKYGTVALDNYQFHNGGYFIDRIGGLDWMFARGNIFPEAGGPIRCYSDSQIDTSFQTVVCDYIQLESSIVDFNEDDEIKLYPIPLTKILTIKSLERIDFIKIHDLQGKFISSHTGSTIDLTNIENGVYFLTIQFDSGQSVKKKIIKT